MAKVLAISSHVVRGHVGLDATVPALQWLGHEVWALPTVIVASRPGLGRMARHDLPAAELAGMLAALEADGCWPSLDAVLTGYFASARRGRGSGAGDPRASRPPIRASSCWSTRCSATPGASMSPPETAEAIRRELLPAGHRRHAQPVRAAAG